MLPKIFHQIWINNERPELPGEYQRYRDTWLKHHPTWDYRLWNLDNLDFTPHRSELIGSAYSYAQMADILRYEILLQHGGVYLDTDFECLKNIEEILDGVKNFACSEDGVAVSIGIIGAEPNSIYMRRCVDLLPTTIGVQSPTLETGPTFLTKVLLNEGINNDFTLFPKRWFYPYGPFDAVPEDKSFTEAYAVHRWAHSWLEAEQRFARRLRRKINRIIEAIR